MLFPLSGVFIALAALTSLPAQVAGQTHATCTNSSFAWSFNSLQQSPCAIGEALGTQCSAGFSIQPLSDGYYYSGILRPYGTDCVCNTVYYSLLSACALCQGSFASPWDQWNQNCTDVWTSQYPKDLPTGVHVPHYAYLALSVNKTFDIAVARFDKGPEATGTATQSTHGPTDPLFSSTSTGGPTNGDDDDSGSKKKSAPIGAIVGGVVGGISAIGLIAVFIFLLLRKRTKSHQAPSAQFIQRQSQISAQAPVMAEQKVYDPNDPSTFPGAASPFSPITPSFTGSTTNPSNPGYNYSAAPYPEPASPGAQHGSFPTTTTPPIGNQPYGYNPQPGFVPPQGYSPPPQNYMPPPGNLQPQRQPYLPEL